MASISETEISNRYEELENKLKNDIDKTFGKCYKLIGRAKWRNRFSSSRKLSDTFGRWNR